MATTSPSILRTLGNTSACMGLVMLRMAERGQRGAVSGRVGSGQHVGMQAGDAAAWQWAEVTGQCSRL